MHHFWCQQRAAAEEVDGVFHELRDRRDGRLLKREDVRLMTDAGTADTDSTETAATVFRQPLQPSV